MWPTPQDYNEAIQSPKLNFDDAELRAGTPELTALGLPRPITGGFASVYQMHCGAKKWAVRCFLRDFPDHQERYLAIGEHLAASKLPYTVGFHFLPKGLRIRGKWYPILKMEWIEGQSFAEVVQANVRNPMAMSALAERWLAMLGAMQKHQIAHGDLQHGNMVIVNGDFRLIDYDGMYVPRLAGRGSHEVGHRNYQHPGRSEKHFGPYLDNFSGWAIYLTLLVLSVDPTFWGRFGDGDEYLLFRREDFEEPRFSRVLRAIEQIKDDRVQRTLAQWRACLATDVDRIPSPVDALSNNKKTPRKAAKPDGPGWWSEKTIAVPQRVLSLPEPVRIEEPRPAPAPVADFEDDAVLFENSFTPERLTMASFALLLIAAFSMSLPAAVPAGGAALAFLIVLSRYVASRPVREKVRAWSWIQRERAAAGGARVQMNLAGRRLNAHVQSEELKVKALEQREARLREKEKMRIAKVENALRRTIDEHNAQRASLIKDEAEEIAQRLTVLQNRHQELATFELSIATISGFGPAIKKKLWDSGVRSAADFKTAHPAPKGKLGFSRGPASVEMADGRIVPIEGLGTKKAAALAEWRRQIERMVQQGTPQSIPPAEEKGVRAKYAFQIEAIALQEKHATEIATARIELIRRKSSAAQQAVRNRIQEVHRHFAGPRRTFEEQLEDRRRILLERRKRVHASRRRYTAYREIRFTKYVRRTFAI